MCLVETDKTLKEVWSKDKKCLRSERFTFLISKRSFNSFLGLLDQELKPVVVLPLNEIEEEKPKTVEKLRYGGFRNDYIGFNNMLTGSIDANLLKSY
jgi:hypothetical protein